MRVKYRVETIHPKWQTSWRTVPEDDNLTLGQARGIIKENRLWAPKMKSRIIRISEKIVR